MDLLCTRRVDPVHQSPRTRMYGYFTHGTDPPPRPYSSGFLSLPNRLRRLPSPAHLRRHLLVTQLSPCLRCRVGGGALARWPPSAAQTVHAVFPHTAFTKTHASGMQSKESIERGSQARTLRTTWFPATVASRRFAIA